VTTTFEIIGKFDTEGDCQKLLYAPPPKPLRFRETQCYKVEYEGDEAALRSFVATVLCDSISQDMKQGGDAQWKDAAFILEYGMKGAALDLEKETIASYYHRLEAPGFELKKLALRKRIYVFGEGADPAPFVRDVVNPAIHTHQVIQP
jgi:hypothetical protein